jgi:hypothetical protein
MENPDSLLNLCYSNDHVIRPRGIGQDFGPAMVVPPSQAVLPPGVFFWQILA